MTKNEIEMVENALRDLNICIPYDLSVEKYPLYLLLGLNNELKEVQKALKTLEETVNRLLVMIELNGVLEVANRLRELEANVEQSFCKNKEEI